ncbi:hypothetical protein HI914_01438 [Erysiphe necator]|nr:hypothetical protein HI914_01438 [Erysiphe necator]
MAEASGSSAKARINNDSAPDHPKKYSTMSEIPKVNLNMQPLVQTTAKNDRAFRVPGEVLSIKDGIPGRIYVLDLKKNTLSHLNGHAVTMGTADGASHKIMEWVSFIFGSGGVSREVHAFVQPDKGITNDLFLLLGLPWLHSVKAVIDIQKSQIELGDRKYGKKRTILQGPTFEFTKYHCLLLQPTKVPFKGALRTKPYLNEKKVTSVTSKHSNALNDKNLSILSKNDMLSNDNLASWDDESEYSSGSEATMKGVVKKSNYNFITFNRL